MKVRTRIITRVFLALLVLPACVNNHLEVPVELAPNEAYADEANGSGFCHEDEPCWNCETMGNHICGPLMKGESH